MHDLSTQLREYFDATASPVEVEEVIGDDLWVPSRNTPPQRRATTSWGYGVAAAAAVLTIIVGLAMMLPDGDGEEVADTTPSIPESVFRGTWVTTDADGSNPIATFEVSTAGVVELVVLDTNVSVCSGAASTMTGTGRLEGATVVVIPEPSLTCGDGTVPEALSGPPLEDQLRDLTFTHDPVTDTVADNLGRSWSRGRIESSTIGWWPQSSLEQVREAQEAADAGDPEFTWQVDPTLVDDAEPWSAEIFARFIEEELGWEAWVAGSFGGYMYGDGGGHYESVLFLRCAPGQTNPLSPLFAEAPPEIRSCAPTIDQLTYETVRISASQLGRKGSDGIWVVDRWQVQQSASRENAWFLDPDYLDPAQGVEQRVPPTDDEVTALLESFLGARFDGTGAEGYLLRDPQAAVFDEVPLLYATTGGAQYERSEIERVQGPVWPNGRMEYRVRLFAEGGTVVEQYFHVVRLESGQLGLMYGENVLPTTEDGQSVPVPYRILDGEVTVSAAPPWRRSLADPSDTYLRLQLGREEFVVIATDPLPAGPDCESGTPSPADASTLVQRIVADPGSETTGSISVRLAGLEGLQMDVDVNDSSCWFLWGPDQLGQWRTRLYVIDYPGEATEVLVISVIAPKEDFERVLDEATPIIDSLEIDTP